MNAIQARGEKYHHALGGSEWKVIALGDSHASELITGLAHAHAHAHAQTQVDAGVVQWTYSGCAFVPGTKLTPKLLSSSGADYKCTEFIDWALTGLQNLPDSVPVVIINRYAQAAVGHNEDRLLFNAPQVYFSKIYDRTTPEFLTEFAQKISSTACEIAKLRTVYLVRPIPEMGFDVPKTLVRRMAFGQTEDVYITQEAYQARNAWVWAAQDAACDQCGIKIWTQPHTCAEVAAATAARTAGRFTQTTII